MGESPANYILLCASLSPQREIKKVKYVFLLIKKTDDGSKLYKIFDHQPLELSYSGLIPREPSCALVGSTLHVFCTEGAVHRFDTQNPDNGWKTSEVSLPFACSRAALQVMGNLIFMFPRYGPFEPLDHTIQNHLWGYVFDTIEEKGYPIQSPTSDLGVVLGTDDCCGVLDQRGILAPVSDKLYRYDVKHKSWELWDTFIPFPRFCYSSAYLNGIFYFCNTSSYRCWFLHVYDARSCCSFEVKLPISDNLGGWLSIVPIADFKLHLAWHSGNCLIYCKILVLDDPSPSAKLLERKSFANLSFDDLDLHKLVHCLPIDLVPDQDLEEISPSNFDGEDYLDVKEISPSNSDDEDDSIPEQDLEEISASDSDDEDDSIPEQGLEKISAPTSSAEDDSTPMQGLAKISAPTSSVFKRMEMHLDSLLRYKALPKDFYMLYQKNQRMIDFLLRQFNNTPSKINFSARSSFPFSNCVALASSPFSTSDVLNKSIPKSSQRVASMYWVSNTSKNKGYLTRGISFLRKLVK